MMKNSRSHFTSAIYAGLAIAFALPASSSAQSVDIKWDDRGVPHITATTDEGVFFGQGYATASNGLAHLHRIRMAAQGRLAELIGNTSLGGATPVEQDTEMRLIALYSACNDRHGRLDKMTRSALQAYADGVNAYVADLRSELLANPTPTNSPLLSDVLDPLRGDIESGDFPIWTAVDSIASWEWWSYWFGSTPFSKDVVNLQNPTYAPTQGKPDEELTVLQSTDMDATALSDATTYAATHHSTHFTACVPIAPGNPPQFSHGWVVSGAKSASGAALVHSDPHTPVLSPTMLHEVHLVQEDPIVGFNARGVTLTGAPGLFIGFSEDVAWALTSLALDTTDLIHVDSAGGADYFYDEDGDGTDETYMIRVSSTNDILVKGGSAVPLTTTSTKYGPIVTPLVSQSGNDDWVLRANFNADIDRHTVQSAARLLKSRDVAQMRRSFKLWVNPTLHAAFGDSNGDIGYTVAAAVPTRGDDAAAAGFVAVANGSDPDNDWVRHVPYDLLPWSISSNGEFLVANQRPAGCWYPIPLLLSFSSFGPNPRSTRIVELFEGTTTLDHEDIAEFAFDATSPWRRELVRVGLHLVDLQQQSALGGYVLGNRTVSISTSLAPWLAAGAEATTDDSNFGKILTIKERIASNKFPLLASIYGVGTSAAMSFVHDIAARDFTINPLVPQFKPSGEPDNYDAAVVHFFDVKLKTEGTAGLLPGAGDIDITYFGFNNAIGGTVQSENSAKDEPVTLRGIDSGTLWSPISKSYSHSVDLGNVDLSRALHPIGNHEDPDHPTLGDHHADSITAVWTDGDLAAGAGFLAAMEHASLELPGTGAPQSPPLDSDAPTPTLPYAPLETYYGLGHDGDDRVRASSISLLNPPAQVVPGGSIEVLLSDTPDGFVRWLFVGLGKDYDTAAAPPNIGLTTSDAIFALPGTSGDVSRVLTNLPAGFDEFYFQGLFAMALPSGATEIRTTPGLAVKVTQGP